MVNIRRRRNLIVILLKFTYNKEILTKVIVTTNFVTKFYPNNIITVVICNALNERWK